MVSLDNDQIDIIDGRHPVVERNLPIGAFVANDTYIDNKNDMVDLIMGYDYKMGNVNRRLAEEHLSSQTMVNSFTKVIKELYYA